MPFPEKQPESKHIMPFPEKQPESTESLNRQTTLYLSSSSICHPRGIGSCPVRSLLCREQNWRARFSRRLVTKSNGPRAFELGRYKMVKNAMRLPRLESTELSCPKHEGESE